MSTRKTPTLKERQLTTGGNSFKNKSEIKEKMIKENG